jgi:CyaY protein
MDESEFEQIANEMIHRIEAALDACDADLDFQLAAGGVLEVEFADRSKIIVNRHGAAQEIWVAARSGGFHFRFGEGQWRDTRSGEELFAALSRLCSLQAGEPVSLG